MPKVMDLIHSHTRFYSTGITLLPTFSTLLKTTQIVEKKKILKKNAIYREEIHARVRGNAGGYWKKQDQSSRKGSVIAFEPPGVSG
jgi:hypothetical protein